MKQILFAGLMALIMMSCADVAQDARETIDFNDDWKFHLGDVEQASATDYNDEEWRKLRLPHDWSIEIGYEKPLAVTKPGEVRKSTNDSNLPSNITAVQANEYRKTASSTGFVQGGIGWYRKSFQLNDSDRDKNISIEFDGIYTRSKVWVNGQLLGYRPNGYISFAYDLSPYLNFEGENVIAVQVDHTNYVDSRWYTGSGIYRNVRLVKKANTHIVNWGVRITTPKITRESADVVISTELASSIEDVKELKVQVAIADKEGNEVATINENIQLNKSAIAKLKLNIVQPKLWDIENPHLYTAHIKVFKGDVLLDNVKQKFGVRTAEFTADKGFFLNGKSVKIKGVNLHHDAGAVGAAVPIDVWKRRLLQLQSIGCNAIRTAHNPYAPEFLDLCDELGMLVDAEFYDEWSQDKDKHTTRLGANDAPASFAAGYSEYFNEWGERDLKDCIRRDFNHPSIIMWSIGNEIEWTFPYYSQTYNTVNGKVKYYEHIPNYDSITNKKVFEELSPEVDSLVVIANQLVAWTKELDTTRPVTIGSVLPVVGLTSGLGQAVDVLGFNYRAVEYDGAHEQYPNLKILGSENNGTWEEWKAVADRDFVAGIFTWTGIAYMGEAGPFPRKGLNLSFFDFACFKTPRGHFYECLWKDDPKVYIGTAALSKSEFQYDKDQGFSIQLRTDWLRRWTWYDIDNTWNYEANEDVVVMGYTNCEVAELFLNGKSFGKQKVNDNEDHIIKWLVPFTQGELKIVGYNNDQVVDEYSLKTAGSLAKISIESDVRTMNSNGYDVAHIEVNLQDENGVLIPNKDVDVTFEVTGAGSLIAVDNGWEYNVQSHQENHLITHQGKALGIIQAAQSGGTVQVIVSAGDVKSEPIIIKVE
ncbi:glycoside hydrolase family 2 TIM barrel-domain containing protein [Labilibacter marinus]|uniref:glycoside hydrolase family 2 TIM barrel-domain containing protein n=1 Tax=Labilibacter marinus TaxID=1477105 RepID=UPI0008358CE2|nr:glycoside hydrolase family 2 TIM barrel-domain containing protein [Labilibacter marinus]